MPIGAGAAPAGVAPAGYGLPDTATTPIGAILPDPKTGLPQPGRAINPQARDYIFLSSGQMQGLGQVPQLVQLAITTTLGSSAVPGLGQAITRIQEQGPNFRGQVQAAVGAALANLVSQNLVQITSINVQTGLSNPDAVAVSFTWRDLTTGIQYTTPLGQ